MTAFALERDTNPAASLAHLLHDLEEADHAFSPEQSAQLDILERFPDAACKVLDEFGLNRFYVPARHGGLLEKFADLSGLWRVVAQHDLTVAVAHGKTFLGAVCVWVAGNRDQAASLAEEICAGTVIAWALTERHHGSDLLAGEFAAQRTPDGWRIRGEKWPINNATRGQMICVLARTRPEGGPRGFSLFLVDKRQLPPGSYSCLPKEHTHGIRGADISGIVFHDALVPESALVGSPGAGIEIVLKALQLTRTACVALSLGAGDHALRLALDFAAQHQIYGRQLIDLPPAHMTLGETFTALMVAEAVSLTASRSFHALPSEMSVSSAIAKSLVPAITDELVSRLGELLGARAFLLDVYQNGMFQKLERDHRIVAIFDGSTVVNRNALINQFPLLGRAYLCGDCDSAGVALAMALSGALPDADPGRLSLVSETGCSIVQSIPAAIRRVHELAMHGAISEEISILAKEFQVAVKTVISEMADYKPSSREVPPAAFDLAIRYELCFAGAACLQLWLHNADDAPEVTDSPLWKNALWLEACMVFILLRLLPKGDFAKTAVYSRLANQLKVKQSGREFSIFSQLTERK